MGLRGWCGRQPCFRDSRRKRIAGSAIVGGCCGRYWLRIRSSGPRTFYYRLGRNALAEGRLADLVEADRTSGANGIDELPSADRDLRNDILRLRIWPVWSIRSIQFDAYRNRDICDPNSDQLTVVEVF